ncbi:OmpH family outer membrane protein [Cognatishimia sp. SS12]|uniref:OmpH family outer membrane protein n=1 Tax=Cognatishimia sp. SS12 TaxID=2979465 RepID=UPI00232B76E4|nr:OmpH family outer membrane protein [Cognatishimia sp. SS12]MDC0737069.1 OmpH family outer membrane protein [Cognatishimia sp. SS12]
MRALAFAVMLLGAGFALAPVSAQQQPPATASQIVIIDSERLYLRSDFGERALAEQEAAKAVLLAENRQIAAELAAEEEELTKKRETMPAEDFRKLADAFDGRVQEIRNIQDEKERTIVRQAEEARRDFFASLSPVLQRVLTERGASIILEKRATFASSSSLDITDRVLQVANTLIGDGHSADNTDASPTDN